MFLPNYPTLLGKEVTSVTGHPWKPVAELFPEFFLKIIFYFFCWDSYPFSETDTEPKLLLPTSKETGLLPSEVFVSQRDSAKGKMRLPPTLREMVGLNPRTQILKILFS